MHKSCSYHNVKCFVTFFHLLTKYAICVIINTQVSFVSILYEIKLRLSIGIRKLISVKAGIFMKFSEKVKIFESDGFKKISGTFDTIITNPPIRAGKAVIYKMYEDAKNHLSAGGILFLVLNPGKRGKVKVTTNTCIQNT